MFKPLAGLLLCSFIATAMAHGSDAIAPYQQRFGRAQPVIAVIGENSGTELTDFAIPYGVLARSGAAQVLAVATQPGPMTMRPALKIEPQATVQQFDARFPDGADYVIVPAVVHPKDEALLAWITAQAAKGATVVSICDGALVVANSGLLKGHRATGHWATDSYRKEHYPETEWISNIRYVADGKVISSAGISAALPTALALVQAIAGHDRAAAVAREVGISDWGTEHDSDRFHPHLGSNLGAHATRFTNNWFHASQSIGVPVTAGVDEIALAFTADAWSRTDRGQAYAVAAGTDALPTRSGLLLLPERVAGGANPPDLMLPPLDNAMPAGRALDQVLESIALRYGDRTAFRVALDFEYPSFQR